MDCDIASNAKAIQALTHSITELKQEWQKDRRGIYELLARLTSSAVVHLNLILGFPFCLLPSV